MTKPLNVKTFLTTSAILSKHEKLISTINDIMEMSEFLPGEPPVIEVEFDKVISGNVRQELEFYYRQFGWGAVVFEYRQYSDPDVYNYGEYRSTFVKVSPFLEQVVGATGAVGMPGAPGNDGKPLSTAHMFLLVGVTAIISCATTLGLNLAFF